MNVLSLFDGISCGRIALDRAGITPKKYWASEVDKNPITISKSNWSDIDYIGDVTKIRIPKNHHVDLLIGGSPCQGFSFAGKQLNFDDPRSKLFFDFVRILKECRRYNPGVKFMLENVVMKQQYQDVISDMLGVSPVKINSSLVSAQNRKRLYWTNISEIDQPKDRGIYLDDILLPDTWPICSTERRTEEAKAIRKESMKQGRDFSPRRGKELVGRADRKSNCLTSTFSDKEHLVLKKAACIKSYGELIYRPDKSQCLDANYYKGADNHGQRTGYVLVNPDLIGLTPGEPIPVPLSEWRKLDPIECERLQTLPDNYTYGVSDSQRYKMIGNAWTVDVVTHIFKGL